MNIERECRIVRYIHNTYLMASDNGNEFIRTVIREIFSLIYTSVDGISAGIIHLLQPSELENYYVNRRKRLSTDNNSNMYCEICGNLRPSPIPDSSEFNRAYYNPEYEGEEKNRIIVENIKENILLNRIEDNISKKRCNRGGIMKILRRSTLALFTLMLPNLLRHRKYAPGCRPKYINILENLEHNIQGCEGCGVNIINLLVLTPEYYTTGLLQDIEICLLVKVERIFIRFNLFAHGIFALAHKLFAFKGFTGVTRISLYTALSHIVYLLRGFSLRTTRLLFNSLSIKNLREKTVERLQETYKRNKAELERMQVERVDRRSMETLIKAMGYPYESIRTTTEDGIILYQSRIAQPNSHRVLICQHGICDTPFTWIANSASDSICCRAWEMGFDIFLTTFRGVLPRHSCSSHRAKAYWNYSVDEMARYDLAANVDKILELKSRELGCSVLRIQITYLGHSMGGMVLLMYIIIRAFQGKLHSITQAILLSPAGMHTNPNSFVYFLERISRYLKIFTPKVAFPEFIVDLLTKIIQDLKSLPASKDLLSYLGARLLTGGLYSGNTPYSVSARMYNNVLSYGISLKVIEHFRQLTRDKTFQSYCYGSKRNQQIYGTSKPFNYIENFDKINIPIHFMVSLSDGLIKPDDVLKQFRALQLIHPDLAHLKLFDGFGHAEYTYLSHPLIMEPILDILKS